MAGRHAAGAHDKSRHYAGPTAARRRPALLPALAGTAVAALLIGGAVLSLRLTATNHGPAGTSNAQALATDPADGADRAVDRADRGARPQPPGAEAPPSSSVLPSSSAPPSSSPAPAAAATSRPASPPVAPTGSPVSSGTCQASFYDTGATTANGEHFDPTAMTAASKTLPFNTQVRVTNVANNSSVVVRVNDRGPYVAGRCLDLTTAAFKLIASVNAGVASVRYEVLK